MDMTPLRTFIEGLPISAFTPLLGTCASESMRLLFGEATTVRETIHCDPLGAWVDGWTVIARLDPDGPLHTFWLGENFDEDTPAWKHLNRGHRIEQLTRTLGKNHVTTADDLLGLAQAYTKRLATSFDLGRDRYGSLDGFEAMFKTFGVLNDVPSAWMLHHVLSVMTDEETEAFWFLTALGEFAAETVQVRRILEAVNNVVANQDLDDNGERCAREAVQRIKGVTLTPAQVERCGVAGALMAYPYDQWESVIDELVEHMYLTQSLDAAFYPPKSRTSAPASTPAAREASPTSWPFIIAS